MIGPIIDVNVYLSRWPFRRLPGDEPAQLVQRLRRYEVEQAWAGSFDALLHKDIEGVNRRLVQDCRDEGGGILQPIGTVNPKLPDWEEDLRRCHEVHGMKGIRLHPNYHGYDLNDSEFLRFLELAEKRNLIVQIPVIMEDERTQHPLVRVAPVNLEPLVDIMPRVPKLRVVLANCFRMLRPDLADKLRAAGQVYFEISMLEGIGGVGKLAAQIPPERILFGSYYPMFQFESAWLKLKESELAGVIRQGIMRDNARKLLAEEKK